MTSGKRAKKPKRNKSRFKRVISYKSGPTLQYSVACFLSSPGPSMDTPCLPLQGVGQLEDKDRGQERLGVERRRRSNGKTTK